MSRVSDVAMASATNDPDKPRINATPPRNTIELAGDEYFSLIRPNHCGNKRWSANDCVRRGVATIVITLTAIFSIGGNLSSTMLATPRLTLSLADHRLLPQWFGQINEKYSSPANSIVFLGGVLFLNTLLFRPVEHQSHNEENSRQLP